MIFDILNAPIFATRTAATIAEVREAIQLPSGRWAAHAADAYTRTTGWPATVMTCGVEEALEALSALATAYGDRIPVFAWLMVEGMYIDDVKRSARALSHSLTVIRYKEAFEYIKDRHGPQIVLIDESDLLEFLPRHFQASQRVKLEYAELNADEQKALRTCKRPLLTLGWWTFQHNAPDKVLAFASGVGAPIALLPTFHGIRPDLFEDFCREAERTGVLLLPAASIVWTEAFIGADLIYALGGELNEGTLYGLHDFPWVKAKVIEQYRLPFPGIDTGERSRRARWLQRLHKRTANVAVILDRARTLLKSGSNLPIEKFSTSSTELYKLVPKGEAVTPYSPFFMTKKELSLLQRFPEEIRDRVALPMESHAHAYDIYKVKPRPGKLAVYYDSIVAPTKQGLLHQHGGGVQSLIPNRGAWTDPEYFGTIYTPR